MITEHLPARIAKLPRDSRGYPVPWFCSWNPDGTPNFQTADGDKSILAIKNSLCWVCGERLGRHLSFVIGPMCLINRVSAEPPHHRECSEFSLRVCPFLLHPNMKRMPTKYQDGYEAPAGTMIERNPGVAALWITRSFQLIKDNQGGILFRVGEPEEISWWAEGRTATRAEVMASIESGLPILSKYAAEEGPEATNALHKAYREALKFLPNEPNDNAGCAPPVAAGADEQD
jgi:hypothetical protein